MKIAVFSDIHGNLSALKTILKRINEENPDLTIFLGDIFQRGHEEIECLELLKESGIVCIKGNCELYLANGVDIDPDVEYLRDYYDGARDKLTDEQLQFVKEMPLFYETECCGHRMKNGTFDKTCESEDITKYDLIAIGHCHQNFIKGNVLAVSASGLENPSCLLIEADKDVLSYEHISI